MLRGKDPWRLFEGSIILVTHPLLSILRPLTLLSFDITLYCLLTSPLPIVRSPNRRINYLVLILN